MNDVSFRRLNKYFVIRQSGAPSSSIALDFAASTSRRSTEAPEWLIRHCEVGDAIFSLPANEQKAVEARWSTAIHVDECIRAIRVASAGATRCRREQSDASQWKLIIVDADREMREATKRMHKLEDSDYRRGMDKLRVVLACEG